MDIEDIKSPLPSREIEINSSVDFEEPIEPKIIENKNAPSGPETPIIVKNKIDWKKILIITGILIGILILVLVITSAIKNSKKDTIVTLNYWSLWEDESVMNSVIADFESKNPKIKINYKRNQITDYRTRLIGRLAKSGSDETEGVDIFRIHNTWIPMFREYLASVPMENVKSIGLNDDFLGVYNNDLKENGNWLSVPLMYDGLALFYNKDLLEAAKIEVPKNWWEIRSAALKLTVKDENGKIKTAGVALGLANSNVDNWSDIVGLMMKQNGIDLSKSNTNTDKNLEDVLKFYASFANGKENVWDESLPNSTTLFANGKLAFYFGPSWRVFDIEQLNKNLKYGITTVPQLPTLGGINENNDNTELTNIHWGSYWTEGVNSKSKYQKESWKFLEYLSSKEVLEKMYTAQSQIRNFGEIYPRKSMSDKLKDNQKVWPFLSVADKANSWYLASNTNDAGVNSEMQKYFGDAINAISQSGDTSEIMTTLKTGINQVQQKYSLKK
ncbi:MAG: extracellular solute-binding protein [Candidatus Shapirobacteria bacterium]